MSDRDNLYELYDIVTANAAHLQVPLFSSALHYMHERFGMGCDVYFRRRLSVCRMMMDLHLPVEPDYMDVLLCTALSHSLPGDDVPEDYPGLLEKHFSVEPRIAELFAELRQTTYADKSYYSHLIHNRDALIIRLTERGVLVESLYEWSTADARRYIRETRESFFPMCIYAKEHYREFLGPVSVLMEKTRNLITANEALLNRYEGAENSISTEIFSLREENAALRGMILDIKSAMKDKV